MRLLQVDQDTWNMEEKHRRNRNLTFDSSRSQWREQAFMGDMDQVLHAGFLLSLPLL